MGKNKISLDSLAWIDPKTDVLYVRVRQYLTNPDGTICKRGFIFKTTSEAMQMTPEACEYKQISPTRDDIQELETEND